MTDASSFGVALSLLDGDQHTVLQTFELGRRGRVTVGRATDNDVVLASPVVSRAHAVLERGPGGWRLVARSAQGVVVRGERKDEHALSDGEAFRLGLSGPTLRFTLCAEGSLPVEGAATLVGMSRDQIPDLELDADRRDREVRDITSGVFFKDLARKAAALRRRGAEPLPSD